MKVANIRGQAALIVDDARACDVFAESGGRFGPAMQDLFADWPAFAAWAGSHQPRETFGWTEADLGPVSPTPGQVFAVGLNYADHSKETGLAVSREFPPVFPKWSSSIAAPNGTVSVPEDSHVDWEVELVAVVGREISNVTEAEALDHLAGFCVGQDFSDRGVQFIGSAPQFGLAKSFKGFSPVGPWIVPTDAFSPDARITCEVDGVVKQTGTLGDLIFPVAEVIAILSRIVTLKPGDLVFTGTPSGVGYARKPPEFLQPGSTVVSTIEGIGSIRQTVVAR